MSDAVPLVNDLFLRALRREPVERTPVWMMRQAGRYLPEYRAVRSGSNFLTMCRTPALAAEVTLQPIDLIGVDAAIIFSDILVVPEAMGCFLTLDEGVGPQFPTPIRSAAAVKGLRTIDPYTDLGYVLDALKLVKRELNGRVPLIGFAGAPWTLASYMVEGKGTKQFAIAKKMLFEQPAVAHDLLDRLANAVGEYCVAQVQAGAQAIQLFDSWAGALGPAEFREFALPYLARAAKIAKTAGAPVIVFAPGATWALDEIADATEADAIGVDWHIAPAQARKRLGNRAVAVQGNLDPCTLYAPIAEIERRTHAMLDEFGPIGHIANLGHGILPDISPAHAKAFVRAVQQHEWPTVSESEMIAAATATVGAS
jgi:uroporphyrinogen decarboxylase